MKKLAYLSLVAATFVNFGNVCGMENPVSSSEEMSSSLTSTSLLNEELASSNSDKHSIKKRQLTKEEVLKYLSTDSRYSKLTLEEAMFEAVRQEDLETVKLIAGSEDFDINVKDAGGKTPLHDAVNSKNFEAVKYLVEHGADVNAKNNDENTPLFLASRIGSLAEVKYLVEQGADVNASDIYGYISYYLAVSEGIVIFLDQKMEESKQKFLESINFNENEVDRRDGKGNTPLMLACAKGEIRAVKYLFKRQANINAVNNEGNTPLLLALQGKHHVVVEYLIRHGADVDKKNRYTNKTPLMFASINQDSFDFKRILKKSKLSINERDNSGKTALMYVIENEPKLIERQLNNIQELVKYGADLDLQDDSGRTALMYAIMHNRQEIVEQLIQAKADVNMIDKGKNGALDYALIYRQDKKMIKLLEDAGAKQHNPYSGLSDREFMKVLKDEERRYQSLNKLDDD